MFSYEKLPVYQEAKAFHGAIFKFLKAKKGLPSYIKNQLGRAALSIMLNIAEGSGRFANADRKHFLVMARSSAFECAAILNALMEENEVASDEGNVWLLQLESVSKALFGMIKNLEG